MKETVKVGIGGYAFTCDVDAYEVLSNYLDSLKSYFGNKNDRTEIINDIESRMSELLLLKGEAPGYIITLADAQDIIGIMGQPSDIADEDTSGQAEPYPHKKEPFPAGKRIYRDTDNAIFGGVFSGLGHYFRLDPVTLRIVYLALFFFCGFTWEPLHDFGAILFITYFVLWIVVPKAQTFQQKLAMSGKDSSVDSIASGNANDGVRGSSLGRILKNILKVFGGIILFSIVVACILMALFFLFFPSVVDQPSVKEFLDVSGLHVPCAIPLILIIWFVPIFMIIYAIIRLIKRFLLRDLLILAIAFAVWLAACSYCVVVGVNFAKDYQHESTVTEKIVPQMQSDTLHLQLGNPYRISEALFDGDEVFLIDNGDAKTWFMVPHVNIKRDKKYENIEIDIRKKAFGKSRQIAEDKANTSRLDITQQGSDIIISPHLYNKNNVWDREVFSITIYCPEDKTILVDKLLEPRTRGKKEPQRESNKEIASEQKEADKMENKLENDSIATSINDSTTIAVSEKI